MLQRTIATAVLLAMAWPVSAQNVAPVTDDSAKPQVMMFELGLQNAVDLAVQKLAQHASQLYPGVFISSEGSPVVQGFVERQLNLYVFNIQVPDILETSLQILSMMRSPSVPRSGTAPQPVGGRVTASAGAIDPDIMTASPVVGARDFDPNREYRAHVRAALADAMLDNSIALPLLTNDRLMVVATGTSAATATSPLRRSKLLILTIKSSDLADFRSGKITRDEAKQRITETQF